MRPRGVGSSGVSVKLMAGADGHPPNPWRTPTPYVFLVLGFMMGVIALALLVLICTRRNTSSLPSSDEKAAAAARTALAPLDREPKGVVLTPGDRAPSFVASAKPLGGDDGTAAV